jgi:twitching motility protein PilT
MEEIAGKVVRADRLDTFRKHGEADCAYSLQGVGRFRVNAFRQRGSVAMVFRRVQIGSPGFEALGLPAVSRSLAEEPRGLILVTGPTGSGKTTTLSAMIDHINSTRECHIVTLEDPIEVLHPDKVASINQREIGVDTADFVVAMRAAVRQDPDVILVGEMRDTETVRAALAASETGHLVMSTLHTIDATETVNRVIDFFPPYQHNQIRVALAGSLRGIICQRLAERIDGGRLPVLEVLVNNGRIQTCIVEPDKTSDIHQIVSEGEYYGMQTFDQHLFRLFRDGAVDLSEAMRVSSKPADFRLMIQNAGLLSVDDAAALRVGV